MQINTPKKIIKIKQIFPIEFNGHIALILGAVAAAFVPIFIRYSEVGQFATGFYRMLLCVPILWLWMQLESNDAVSIKSSYTSDESNSAKHYLYLLSAGVLLAADLGFLHWSIALTSVSNAVLLNYTAPVFVTIGAWLFFGTRSNCSFLVGMFISMLGVSTMMGGTLISNTEQLFGDFLGLISAVFFASYLLLLGQLRALFSTAKVMTWTSITSGIVLGVIALLSGENMLSTSILGWVILFALAFISQAGGQSLVTFALAKVSPAISSVILLLQPVLAAALAWIILEEPLGPWQGVSIFFVLTGVYIAGRMHHKAP